MQTGQPLSPSVRAQRSDIQCLQNINRSIRSDWGGQPPTDVIYNKLAVWPGLDLIAGLTEDQADILSDAVYQIVRDQISGVRKRTAHDREELLRRAATREEQESEGDPNGLLGLVLNRITELERKVSVLSKN